MLDTIGVTSLDELIDQTIPRSIRLSRTLHLPEPMTEQELASHLQRHAAGNTVTRSFLGQGYAPCHTPPVIQRMIFESPGWYTQYTPYQAEISQGRLEALLNFQTMISDLTGMAIANASLLDEGTAAGEGMTMVHALASRSTNGNPKNRFFVSSQCFIQTIEVLRSRAEPLGFELVVGDHRTVKLDQSFFGALLQYPGERGEVHDYQAFIQEVHAHGAFVIVAADLLSLALLKPPGEFGADIVVGSAQRFGVPMGFGGPHAAFFATREEFVRHMPGRIIGVSVDAQGRQAYRMTLQTREQHIRREKATSNICTAQALLAIMAGMYAVYHGPEGLRSMASRIHRYANALGDVARRLGYGQENAVFFDTVQLETNDAVLRERILHLAETNAMNFRPLDVTRIGISLDETTRVGDLQDILSILASARKAPFDPQSVQDVVRAHPGSVEAPFGRTSSYLQHPVFNSYHSETQMMRYIKRLENKDLSLVHSMIPLGSCTMKLNAASELMPVSWPAFATLHPFAPPGQWRGYQEIFGELEKYLAEITGFHATSLQPNSGAQGEFAGLSVIRAYHVDRGDTRRTVALIPSSAHGTNPASAVMAGLQVVIVRCDEAGNIDVEDLKAKAEAHRDHLAALMVTYPSTHGVFEESIREICAIVHDNGGLVYMDGANMNAQVGLTDPATIGADVCHLNLHKTFSIPHGGGGPGAGPICVNEKLAPYLPGHPIVKTGGAKAIPAVASAPYGSASILLISYAYIRMLGSEGLADATRYAILNANYLKARLQPMYPILYQGKTGRVAHEFILNPKQFKESASIEVEDIAKRLMDYGFHAPTVSFPVAGTLMIEPTESEPKEELDRFVEAMSEIRSEIQAVLDGKANRTDNVLKHAPHTALDVISDSWAHPYGREQAAFPVESLRLHKFWPPVGRINNTYGDRNLVCTCPPLSTYVEKA